MIRRITFIRRKAGLTTDEFFALWMGRHAELVSQLPRLRGLRLTRVDRCAPEGQAWDGLGEQWFDSLSDCDHAFATEPLRSALLADRQICIEASQTCFVEEPEGFAPPDGMRR